MRSLEAPFELVQPPGGYGDGPAYVRVSRKLAGEDWRRGFHGIAVACGVQLGQDPGYDFVYADHTLSAFAYLTWMRQAGLPADGLAVVRSAVQEGAER